MMLWYLLILIFILGLVVGSFLNVWILRGVAKESLSGRSKCPHCQHVLGYLDLIPLFSFLFLRGKCHYCGHSLSWQYPLVELGTAVLFAGFAFYWQSRFGLSFDLFSLLTLAGGLLTIAILITVFVTDLRLGLIPNKVIIPGIILLGAIKIIQLGTGLLSQYLHLRDPDFVLGQYLLQTDYFNNMVVRISLPFVYDVLSALGIGVFFYLIVMLSRGRAMGGGDIKLGFFLGLANGWPLSLNYFGQWQPMSLVALLLSFILGAIFSIGLLVLRKRKMGQTIPFGPFLVLASLLVMFWGQAIFDWYINLLR